MPPFTRFYTRVYAINLAAGSRLVATTPHLLFRGARGTILTPWSIAGTWLIYTQYAGDDPAGPWTLAARNMSTGQTVVLDTPAHEGVPSLAAQAASDGRTIVWQSWTMHRGQATSVIRAYDTATRQEHIVAEGGSPLTWSYGWPAVAGRRVVFEREVPSHQMPHAQILLADLDTGHIRALTPATAADSEPAISGDIVIWKEGWRFADGHGVTVYNMHTGTYHRITATQVEQPKVTAGRYVVYPSGTPFQVQLYDVRTGARSTLAAPQPDGYGPGNVVVVGDHMVVATLSKASDTTRPLPTRLLITTLP